tara:strand:+ start:2098 stop:2757 length:660 start_codon:yes stop_codon:yes gene_type:complete
MNSFIRSSIGKKIMMALSAIFLMVFLIQHLLINITSTFSISIFNSLSHFMGTNLIVQFILQPILIFGVLFHFSMGFYLEYSNKKARTNNYIKINNQSNSSWISRNMIISGLAIFVFLILHFIDFWIPEIQYKYIDFLPENPDRYYSELKHKFNNPIRVIVYCISFVLLSLHLLHGFASSLKSLGTNKKYISHIKFFGYTYSIGVPLAFCFIALFHYFNH